MNFPTQDEATEDRASAFGFREFSTGCWCFPGLVDKIHQKASHTYEH
jgi:hypothetical protein